MAVSWPDGLEVLLERGKFDEFDLNLALFCAIEQNRLSSVQLLLNAGMSFKLWGIRDLLELDADMCDILVKELVRRRSAFRNLAETILPTEELTRLGVSKEQLPDANFDCIRRALMARGVAIPNDINTSSSYRYKTSSILEQVCCLRLMKCLHRAGFRSMCRLTSPAPNPPEMVIDRALWLTDMGLNLKTSEAGLPTTLELWPSMIEGFIHVTTRGLIPGSPPTCKLVCQTIAKTIENLNERQQQFWRDCISSNELDSCSCACSPANGCRSISIALKELSGSGQFYPYLLRDLGRHTCFRSNIMEFLFRDQIENFDFVLAVLRFLTFNELGLTHTCHFSHDRRFGWGEPAWGDDATEKLEEEKLLLEQLDVLVSEFQQKYLELHIPLIDFIRGYWADKMREFLFRREIADAQVIQGAKKVGVWLDWEPVGHVELLLERPCIHAPTRAV